MATDTIVNTARPLVCLCRNKQANRAECLHKPGRRGFISTVDVFTTQKENRKIEREEKLGLYKEKVANRISSDVYDFTSSDTEENHSSDNSSDDDFKFEEKKIKKSHC
ncbi:hypothetical protein ACI65C_006314 [Semiaphis heraclei]